MTHSGQHALVVWDATDGNRLREIDVGIEGIWDFAFSPDGKTVAAVGFQLEPKRNVVVNHLVIAEVATGRLVRRCEWDDQDNVQKVAYAADDKTVATVSLDGTLRLCWDVATSKLLGQERLVADGKLSQESIEFSPQGASRMLAVARRGTVDLWDVVISSRPEHRGRWTVFFGLPRFSPDGMTLAAGIAQREVEIRLWRVGDGTSIGRYRSRKDAHVEHMAFSPDGKVLAAIGTQGPPVFLTQQPARKWTCYPALVWWTVRWLFRAMAERSRPQEPGRPFTSGNWRQARTDWPLSMPTLRRRGSRMPHPRQDTRLRQ